MPGNEAMGMRPGMSVGPDARGFSLLDAPKRATGSCECLSRSFRAIHLATWSVRVGHLGGRSKLSCLQVTTGTGRKGRRKEAQRQVNGQKGEATSHPGLNGSGQWGLTDTGQALVQGTGGESKETYHPGVPRTQRASKNTGLSILKQCKVLGPRRCVGYPRRYSAFNFRQVECSQVLQRHSTPSHSTKHKLGFSAHFC